MTISGAVTSISTISPSPAAAINDMKNASGTFVV